MASPLIWLSGAQPDVLANFNHDRPKYVGTGSAVLFTSVIAASSMAFALHMALKAPVLVAIVFGLAWGVGIMSLDRWLVSSMARNQGALLAVPRVLLAILFSVVISTPLTLQIFNSEIAQRISIDQATAAANFATSSSVAKLTAKVNQDNTVVRGYQDQISTGGKSAAVAPADDQVLTTLENTLAKDKTAQSTDFSAWYCQVYGPISKCPPGSGPAAAADLRRYQADTASVASDNQRITGEETTLNASNVVNKNRAVSNATDNLKLAQTQQTSDTNALNRLKSGFDDTNTNNTGILARLKALDELRMSDLSMLIAEIVLFLFFAAIELLPVIVKLLLNRGEETAYEKAVVSADVINIMREEYGQRSRYLNTVRQHDQDAAQARAIKIAWEEQMMPEVTSLMIEAKRQVELDKIERWRRGAMLENGSYGRGWEPAGLPRLRYRGELGSARLSWPQWLPRGTARRGTSPKRHVPAPERRVPVPGLAATKPFRALNSSGPLPTVSEQHRSGWPRR